MTDRLTGRSQAHVLAALRSLLANIDNIDPDSPTFARICTVLDTASDEALHVVAGAEIRYLSLLAKNRIYRRANTAH